jgi:type II secretory pathway component PulF
MPAFAYQAVDPTGKRLRGRADAATPAALTRTLEERGLLVLEVDSAESAPEGGFGFGKRREVLEVTRAMAALLPAGMPLAQALGAASGVTSGDVRETLQQIRGRVERGDMLSVALAAYPKLFSPLYIGIVRAGEKSGDLDAAFERLATQLERDEQLRGRVLSAAIYPILLAIVGSIAVVVLLMFVLPRFAELLEGSGAALPTSTAILLGISTALNRYWAVLALLVAALIAGGIWAKTTPDGQRAWAWLLLALPLVGTLRRYALAARFARLTSVLVGGGAPLFTALEDTVESIGDPIARDDIARIRGRVREGASLRQAISEGTLFPPLLAQLVAVGEEAGRLREFLVKAADIFEDRTERATQRVAALAEPAMIVFFGVIVAFVALSLLQAIYGVNATSFG